MFPIYRPPDKSNVLSWHSCRRTDRNPYNKNKFHHQLMPLSLHINNYLFLSLHFTVWTNTLCYKCAETEVIYAYHSFFTFGFINNTVNCSNYRVSNIIRINDKTNWDMCGRINRQVNFTTPNATTNKMTTIHHNKKTKHIRAQERLRSSHCLW
jgi:hypothetical protein